MATRTWQRGPKGGRYYVDATGEKRYGQDAIEASKRDTMIALHKAKQRPAAVKNEAITQLAQARASATGPTPKPPVEYLPTTPDGQMTVEPIRRGPGPVISSAQAEAFSKGSKFPHAFVRGTDRPHEGVYIAPATENLSLQGRGVYMVQAEDAEMTSRYGTRQDIRVNIKNPIDFYGTDARKLRNSKEYKATLKHVEKHFPRSGWQTQEAMAFQATAQSRGHDATYYEVHENKPEGGQRKTGRVVLTVWDANKVAVVKD